MTGFTEFAALLCDAWNLPTAEAAQSAEQLPSWITGQLRATLLGNRLTIGSGFKLTDNKWQKFLVDGQRMLQSFGDLFAYE